LKVIKNNICTFVIINSSVFINNDRKITILFFLCSVQLSLTTVKSIARCRHARRIPPDVRRYFARALHVDSLSIIVSKSCARNCCHWSPFCRSCVKDMWWGFPKPGL